jgi:DNA-binding Lrp family transcriptional regulator
MSQARYSIIPTAALEDDRVTAQQLRILATLGSFMGKDNEGFPSQSKIAERAKCSRQTVNKALRCLADFGYIQVIGRTRGGLKRALRYRVILDVNLSDIEAEAPMFPDVKKSDIDVKEGDNDVNPEGDNDVNSMELTAKEDTQGKKPTPKRVSPKKVSEEILSLLPKAKVRMAPRDSLPKVVKTILNQTDEQTLLGAVKACYSDPKHTAEDGQYAPAIYSWLKDGVWKNWVAEVEHNSTLTEEDWAAAFRIYVEGGGWPVSAFSPAPHDPNCTAPAKMLRHAAKLLEGTPAAEGILKNLEIGEAA